MARGLQHDRHMCTATSIIAALGVALLVACAPAHRSKPGEPQDSGGASDVLSDIASDADATEPDVGASACTPPCEVGSVCCTDQHGHFPQCVMGNSCP